MRTLGLYAVDPDKGEILYAVCIEKSNNCYMPPYNGVTVSAAYLQLYTTVGNADSVSLAVSPGAYATVGDIQALEKEIADLKAYVGYSDGDIYGVEVDFENKKFTRLAGAVNRSAGSGFDGINAFGGRKRCNLTNDGRVAAYYGEAGFSTTGKLTQAVDRNPVGTESPDENLKFSAGTIVQVMVEQPKFYYKVVPLKTEKRTKGAITRKIRYYVSDTPKAGFKLHPAFIVNGQEMMLHILQPLKVHFGMHLHQHTFLMIHRLLTLLLICYAVLPTQNRCQDLHRTQPVPISENLLKNVVLVGNRVLFRRHPLHRCLC